MQKAAINNENIFDILLETTKTCSQMPNRRRFRTIEDSSCQLDSSGKDALLLVPPFRIPSAHLLLSSKVLDVRQCHLAFRVDARPRTQSFSFVTLD